MGRTRKNKGQYWLSKNRYYELKHFCLQYKEWQELYLRVLSQTLNEKDDPTGEYAALAADLEWAMHLVKDTALGTDKVLGPFILDHVINGTNYVKLYTVDHIPCGKDLFYALIRKFFYILSIQKGL